MLSFRGVFSTPGMYFLTQENQKKTQKKKAQENQQEVVNESGLSHSCYKHEMKAMIWHLSICPI